MKSCLNDQIAGNENAAKSLQMLRICVMALVLVTTLNSVLAAERDWTLSDSISVRYYGESHLGWITNPTKPAAVPSPNGRYFYVTHFRGDLVEDCLVRTLEIYDSKSIHDWVLRGVDANSGPPPPVRSIEMRSGRGKELVGDGDAIEAMTWNESSTALYFLGTDSSDHDQVYCLEVESGKTTALTTDPEDKSDLRVHGNLLIYRRRISRSAPSSATYPILPITRDEAGDIRLPLRFQSTSSVHVIQYLDGVPLTLPTDKDAATVEIWPAFDGSKVVLRETKFAYIPDKADKFAEIERYLFVDVKNRKTQTIASNYNVLDAFSLGRSRGQNRAIWSPDGSCVIVTNTQLPTESPATDAAMASLRHVATYHVDSMKWTSIEALDNGAGRVRELKWQDSGTKVIVTHQANDGRIDDTIYALEGGTWRLRTVQEHEKAAVSQATNPLGALRLSIRQSENSPPQLIATVGEREKTLSKPDPALEGVWRATVEAFSWKLSDGTVLSGGLALPRSTHARAPLPLVIQTHYTPGIFLPDGPVPAAEALQPMIAKGTAVLLVNATDFPGGRTDREGKTFVECIDAAVDELAKQKIIDPKRVGLIGFSRTGYLTFYAVTHPGRTRLAAAVVVDAVTFSFPEYLQTIINGSSRPEYETINGGDFWKNPERWLEQEVLFNAHRMETPTLFFSHKGPGRTIEEIEPYNMATIAALKANRRPFDFLFLPDAGHTIKLPVQRFAELNATVDWMAYWLLGQEDSNPGKREQYKRWELIKRRYESRNTAALVK